MTRISVVGTSGSGKSTLSRKIAKRLDLPVVELDSIRHQAGWTELPDGEFRRRVTAAAAGESWVIDGGYTELVGEVVRNRATEIVWVDPSRPMLMVQVIWRSFLRAGLRQELWNGNRERFRDWLDPEHPIRWAWSTFEARRDRFEAQQRQPGPSWARLRNRPEIADYLDRLGPDGP